MFRARSVISVTTFAGLLLLALPAIGQQEVNFIDAVGYVDYARPPDFKIGTWLKYHMAGTSASGLGDDYTLTMSMVGEEKFWGEDCFWIETLTARLTSSIALASCISYAGFDDTLRDTRAQLFERKTIMGLDEDGKPIQNIMRRSAGSYRSREKGASVIVEFDTLGTDTVIVPVGDFKCLKVARKEAVYIMKDVGDSTIRGETYETRTFYYSDRVPITSLVREDLDNLILRKAWKIGESDNAVVTTVDHAVGSMRLVDWGDDATASLVPEAFRKPIKHSKPWGRNAAARGRNRTSPAGGG